MRQWLKSSWAFFGCFALLWALLSVLNFSFAQCGGNNQSWGTPSEACKASGGGTYSGSTRMLWGTPYYLCTEGGMGVWCSETAGECPNGWDSRAGRCACLSGQVRNQIDSQCECPDLPKDQQSGICGDRPRDVCPDGDFSPSDHDGLCGENCRVEGLSCADKCSGVDNVEDFACTASVVTSPCKCKVPPPPPEPPNCGGLGAGGGASGCV